MPSTMTRKRPKKRSDLERTPPNRTGKAVQVYLSPELRSALDEYIEATRPTPTITAVIEMALEDLLRKAGAWPRPEQPEAPRQGPE
jgi:hypothetical protein